MTCRLSGSPLEVWSDKASRIWHKCPRCGLRVVEFHYGELVRWLHIKSPVDGML